MEWHELSNIQKAEFLIPPGVLVLIGCAIFIGVVPFVLGQPYSDAVELKGAVELSLFLCAIFVRPLIPYFVVRWSQVSASKRRSIL